MKNYIILLCVLLLAFCAQAQTKNTLNEKLGDVVLENKLPTTFNYKALITKDGEVVSNQNVSVEISLLDEQGNVFFTEEHATKTANTGMVNLNVGTGTTKTGKLEKVDWNKGIFISVKADFGAGYQSLGSPVKMMAVPYALYAANAPLIRSNTTKEDDPIFQVQNSDGFPLFTVYEGGYVTMSVADETTTRRPRGGFAVKSFKDGDATPRLQIADGRFDVYVDPATRRPRGGFAVKSFMSDIRGPEDKEPKTLFSTNDRATYFTLDKNAAGASFQLRNRCDDRVVLAFTKAGKIQTKDDPNNVIESLPSETSSTTFDVTWPLYTPVGSTPVPPSALPGFTNILRWRVPEVKLNGQSAKYDISIEDEPTGARLSDYVRVGVIKDVDPKFGLALANNLKLDKNFVFPNGKIIVSSTEIPSLKKVFDFNGQKMLSYEDVLEIQAPNAGHMIQTNDDFFIGLKVNKITQHTDPICFLFNMNLNVEITDEAWAQCLKVEFESEGLRFDVTDREKFEQKATVGQTHTIPVRVVVPYDIYPPVPFQVQVQVSL